MRQYASKIKEKMVDAQAKRNFRTPQKWLYIQENRLFRTCSFCFARGQGFEPR